MAFIDVIIPVYKVEPYIARCIESILGQTFCDFRLILVNDGSPDRSGKICDEYAGRDSRIHVIHQENKGVSAARNAGIDWVFANSSSQWICFVDSDDWIHCRLLEKLLEGVRQYPVKICACDYQETHGKIPETPKEEPFSLKEPEDFFVPYNTNAVIPVAKLYHKDCFAGVRYPEGKIHEDEMTTFRVLFAQKQIAYTPMPLYFYYYNPESITKSKWTPKRMDSIEAFRKQIQFFGENGFKRAYEASAVGYTYTICRQMVYVKESDLPDEEKQSYLKDLKKHKREAMASYWPFFLHRRHMDIWYELVPCIKPAFRLAQRLSRSSEKGEAS